ncbi:phage portal protein [Streptomyces shenzhenensis]|uniref:Phage capsid protein n=1 Tax=Streptomyces shenzhenensis TaxID=943815 RepID=A0A3M0INP3_9ACTN|nr:phage portal protein [Streptomyces shenzhenensis]RMB83656.1 phage capsid protein [Streptomyces shenzhenensis]
MPLPADNTPWPPPQWARHYREMAVDDAWYSGDRHRLSSLYRAQATRERKWRLWGRRKQGDTRPDHRLHVPLAGDIAATSADLLFADMPKITVEDAATQARLDDLADRGRLQSLCLGAAEQAAALSGVYLRTTWDRDVADYPLITSVQPDQAIPEFRFGMLRSVLFWRELPSQHTDREVWRHIEAHEPGYVRHALYLGTRNNLGRLMSLVDHTETHGLVDSLDAAGDGQTISTGIQQLTASYVPNMLPNRLHRTAPIGRSDYAAPIHDLFDSLDETWTSWMRDIRLARARLIVPDAYLRDNGPGQGATFDGEAEVWAGLKIPPNEGGTGITLAQFKIRVAEHKATAESLVTQAAQSAGYSPSSLGLDSDGQPVTATEVDDRFRRSRTTRTKKAGHWRHALAEQLHVQLLLDRALFGSRVTPQRPTVEFGSGVAESMQSVGTTLDLLARAGAVSTATKVKVLHPEWDDTAVKAEVALILAETGASAPDPVGAFPL